jgi:hypothetical protein
MIMQDLTHIQPTPDNYQEYLNQRRARTELAMSKSKRINGGQIKENNLSVRMLWDAGYTLDPITDTMIKE